MSTTKYRWQKILFLVVGLAITVWLIRSFYQQNSIIFLTLLFVSVGFFARPTRKKKEIITYGIGAIVGPSMEAIIIDAGVWAYANPSMFGVPIWLPLLWGLTACMMMKVAEWFE